MTERARVDELMTLASHKQVRVRVAVASDSAATSELLARLASDPSRSVRRVVAARPDTPTKHLRDFVNDNDRQTRQAVATNPSCPADALIALLADPHWSVRFAVLDNPGADLVVRRGICESPDQDMRFMLAQRPGLDVDVITLLQQDPSAEVRAALAEATDSQTALAVLLADAEPRVRGTAGMNPHTTAEQRHRLVHDPAWEARNSVVWSKAAHGWQIPEQDLLVLARDRSVNVRFWLANLPGATRDVYAILAEDPDELVANTARRWLLPSDDPEHPDQCAAASLLDVATALSGDLVEPEQSWGPEYLGGPIPHLQPSRPPSTHTPWSGPAPR